MTAEPSEGLVLEWAVGSAATGVVVERTTIASAGELDEALDRLQVQATGQPFIAELVAPGGASLGIGLGREGSVLAFKSGQTRPPYYVSHNPAQMNEVDGDADIAYLYQGQWTEFSSDALVPMDAGRRAMKSFLATGALPSEVDWVEV